MPNSLMIDLETLGTGRKPIIIQGGWCVFDEDHSGVIHDLAGEVNVNVDSCTRLGGEIDDGAFRFWLTQPDKARLSVAVPGVPVGVFLTLLRGAYFDNKCEDVWSNGSKFDIVIVEHYFEATGIECPWKYNAARDTRTRWKDAEKLGWTRDRVETAHTAMQDSIDQALDVQRAWAYMRGLRNGNVVDNSKAQGVIPRWDPNQETR